MKNDVILRPKEARDLEQISDLTYRIFGLRRDPSVLRWLLENPHDPQQIDSWVAEHEGKIVAHTGILKSRYHVEGRWITGAHAFLWMSDVEYRGTAGHMLGQLILKYEDFLLIVGGSPTTKAILKAKRFKKAVEAKEFRIYRRGEDEISRAWGLDMDYRLIPLSKPHPEAALRPAGVITNEATPEHLEWLASCPDLEAHHYALERGGRYLGPVLLFVNRRAPAVAGRIVHMPFVGREKEPWADALAVLGQELGRLGCRSYTVLATYPALMETALAMGAELAGSRPVSVRGYQNQEKFGPGAWHLTYLEGDLAYRRVEHPANPASVEEAELVSVAGEPLVEI